MEYSEGEGLEKMAKVKIRRGDAEFEITDITFEQLKELVGMNNGHQHMSAVPVLIEEPLRPRPVGPDFEGFTNALSERGRAFLAILRQHQKGIEAHELATALGFADARQIGGLTGGGVAKIAKRFHVNLQHVYSVKVAFPDNKRTVTFYPGKLLLSTLDEQRKPA